MSDAKLDTPAVHPKERSAQLMWTGFIVAFFVLQAILWAVAIRITSNDPSHAILPSYSQPPEEWARQQALKNASQKLGWSTDWNLEATDDVRGRQRLTLTIADGKQAPIENASIELRAFHKARAARPQAVVMTETSPGRYEGMILVRKPGVWKLEGVVNHNDEIFVIDQTQTFDSTLQLTHPPKQDG